MKNSKIISYDGSFNGFLTILYTAFDKNWDVSEIVKQGTKQDELFTNNEHVQTNNELAKKVWLRLERKSKVATKIIYFSFLSEQKEIEFDLFLYVHFIFNKSNETVSIEPLIEKLNIIVAKVEKEKRRMEVFANFQLSESQTSKALLKPKYNILPLISRHIRLAQRDKSWNIFDTKRNYGINYTLGKLEISSSNTNIRQAV